MKGNAALAEPKNNRRRDLVENEIFERATALFAERGFAGTSLQDIADAMGMTRPALYHYVKNKDEILSKLVTQFTEAPADTLAAIRAKSDQSPLERIREMVHSMVTRQAKQASLFRLLILSESELPEEIKTVHKAARRRVLREITAVIEEGIETGELRLVDARVAAFGVLGICNWVAWWYHGTETQTADAIADQLADMAVASIAQTADRRVDNLEAAFKLLRKDIDLLERVATDNRPKRRRAP